MVGQQDVEEEDHVEPVSGMEGAHQPGQSPKGERRSGLRALEGLWWRALEEEVHV
jgi:hypothetical protein